MSEKKKRLDVCPEEAVAAAIMFLMIVLCFIKILARYVFRFSMTAVDQLLIEVFPCAIFICAPASCLRRVNMSFSLLTDQLPKRFQPWVELVTTVLSVLLFATLFYYGGIKTKSYYDTHYTIMSLYGCPKWIFSASIPLGSFLYIIRSIQLCVQAFRHVDQPEECLPSADVANLTSNDGQDGEIGGSK